MFPCLDASDASDATDSTDVSDASDASDAGDISDVMLPTPLMPPMPRIPVMFPTPPTLPMPRIPVMFPTPPTPPTLPMAEMTIPCLDLRWSTKMRCHQPTSRKSASRITKGRSVLGISCTAHEVTAAASLAA